MDVGVAGVLVGDVVVVEADDADRAGGERVPEAVQFVVGAGRGEVEVGLVGAVAGRAVAALVLVVAGGGHPGAVAGGAGVVLEPVGPGADSVGGEVGVAEVPVDEVEQRGDPLDSGGGVAGGGAAQVVVGVAVRGLLAEGGGALVAEAGEGEGGPPARGGADGAELRGGTVVDGGVHVVRVGVQAAQPGVVDLDLGAGLGVPVGAGVGLRAAARPPCEVPYRTRGLPTEAVVCQETTTSREASEPNWRCSPATRGRRSGPAASAAAGGGGGRGRDAGEGDGAAETETGGTGQDPAPADGRMSTGSVHGRQPHRASVNRAGATT